MTEVQTAFSYDPFSLVVQEDPYPYYRTLRDEFPVYHNPERGFFAISRYADLQAASGTGAASRIAEAWNWTRSLTYTRTPSAPAS